MAETAMLNPDSAFIGRIVDAGGGDLKQCFQCATCSIVCELAGSEAPFPRKEMAWAQWGLRDRLLADPDVWRCFQCNDCSARCPRAARPGDVLAAVRQEAVRHYAVPRVIGRLVNTPRFIPLLFALPALLLALALLIRDPLWRSAEGVLTYLHHEGFYAALFPHWLLIGFYTLFWSLAIIGALVGAIRFWRAMAGADQRAQRPSAARGVTRSLAAVIRSIFAHDRFGKCTARSARRTAHLAAFYGFAALFVVSVWAVLALYVINPLIPGHANDLRYPFAIWNPWKILANLAGIALVAGCLLAIRDRRSGAKTASASSSFDWVFLWLLLIVGATGLLTEIMRYVAEPGGIKPLVYVAYSVYFVHLVVVFDLLVYLPHSKFAHVIYRTVALVYAEHTGRGENGARPIA